MGDLISKRCSEITEIIEDLYEDIGYSSVPVDVFEVCRLLKIRIKTYSALQRTKRFNANKLSEDGYNYYDKKRKEYVVYYNDYLSMNRIRFTIAHEIGHIMLEHDEHNILNETEANFFAKTMIAPLCVIGFRNLQNEYDVSSEFQISQECAGYVYSQYQNAMQFPSIRYKIFNGRLAQIFSQYKEI